MQINEKIYLIRKKQGLSQEEFADKLGVSRQAVYKWETGDAVPEIDKIKNIAKLFNVSFDYLLNDNVVETDGNNNINSQKNDYKIRPVFCSQNILKSRQVDIDNGYLPKRRSKLKTEWLPKMQANAKSGLASLGIENVEFLPIGLTATTFFYDTNKRIMGFYYAGEIQFVCPYENIIKFSYSQGKPYNLTARTPIVGASIGAQGINGFGVGAFPQQTNIDSSVVEVNLVYRTETGEIKTFDMNLNVSSNYIIQKLGLTNISMLTMVEGGYVKGTLNKLLEVEAKINEFKIEGEKIIKGEIVPEDFDISLYTEKNKEFKKTYESCIETMENETKEDNKKALFVNILKCIGVGLTIAVAAVCVGVYFFTMVMK